MNKIKTLIVVAVIGLATLTTAQAQTGITKLTLDVKNFFTDQTNIFNQGQVAFEVGPIMNLSNYRFGADADVQFPLAQQASVGFDLLYYGNVVYDGTFNTTLGTTWVIPYIKQPVYTYVQVGAGTDLQNLNNVINEEWAGLKWKYTFGGSMTNLSLTVNGAAGHISNESGTLAKGMAGLEYRF